MVKTDINNIAIIGAGTMGSGIALIFSLHRFRVFLYDVDQQTVDRALANIKGNMKLLADESVIEGDSIEPAYKLIEPTVSLEDAAEKADFVIECVPEKLELKQDIFRKLDLLVSKEAILATNTSVMSISEIAAKAKNKERIIGTHFWNPPFLLPLVEVVQTENSSNDVINLTIDLLRRVGKKPVRVKKDVPGFVANRLQHALWRESLYLVEQGIADPETVDECIKYSFGMRLPVLAPLENMDMVGLDMTLAIHDYIFKYLNNSELPSALLREKVDKGELGFKSGRGFQSWSNKDIAASKEKLTRHLIHSIKQIEPDEIIE